MSDGKYGPFESFEVGGVIHQMRWIPPGRFMMGSPKNEAGRSDDEHLHEVTLSEGYWMGSVPVTQALWIAVMGDNPSSFKGDERPVEQVSWEDSQVFIERLNEMVPGLDARLPTEAQWEYACRAGETKRYVSGDSVEDLARVGWYGENSGGETHPVAQKPPNQLGLYDMHGNVFEWCQDWYGDYPKTPVSDPEGPAHGTHRVRRGGAWLSRADRVRSASRYRNVPWLGGSALGFRLVRGQ